MANNIRRCLECDFEGEMKTWLANYNVPQAIGCLLLLFYIIPGLIFLVWGWGKYKCPQCGAISKSTPIIGGKRNDPQRPLQANRLELLERLVRLREQGALSPEEYEAEKRKLMG